LTHCELELFKDFNETSVVDVTLPFLQCLTLKDPELGIDTDCLQTFITPALRSPDISEGVLGLNPVGSLSSFISKSDCKLQHVQIVDRTTFLKHSYRTASPSVRILFVNWNAGDEEDSEGGTGSDSSDDESNPTSS
jgi:hypothetical protein